MLLLVDSREQLPYWKGSACAVTSLNVGDYTTANLLNRFHIERKSPADLYQTIIHNHPRFRREVLRAEEARITLVVVVEATRERFISLAWSSRPLKQRPLTVDKILTTIQSRYGLEFIWCKNRLAAMDATLARLQKEEKHSGRSCKGSR